MNHTFATETRRLPAWSSRISQVAVGAVPLVVGACSGYLAKDGINGWYRTIKRPEWNSPDQVFGPVWTTLYATMGVALVRILGSDTDADQAVRNVGLSLFALQLGLNGAWSWVFFAEHELGGALLVSIALWLALAATIAAFERTRRGAGILLLPYLAWVSFATLLTAEIWRLNR
jgi:tryptophan-rich sensory protein